MRFPLHILFATLSLTAALPAVALAAVEDAPGEWTGVDRVIAVGDLHGSYDKLVELLQGSGLIDDELRWSGGADHLVVNGDFLDRGSDERELMDLLRRLEKESVAAGGRVHVLLGNHEVMNLFRETRDVTAASFQRFAREESESQRIAALRKFSPDGFDSRKPGDLTTFNRRFPKGFFARQRAFDADGEYGSWLLALPAVVKIDGVVYLHGGMNPEFAELGVDGINEQTALELTRHLKARDDLEQLGVVTPVMSLDGILSAAEETLERKSGRRIVETHASARELIESNDAAVLGSRGPLWYRGNSFEDERIERSSIELSLQHLGAKSIVIAHSPTKSNRITSRFHGQVFRVDYGIHGGDEALALVAEQGEMLVLDTSTGETSRPVRELPSGTRSRASSLPDEELQQFLRAARVVESRELGGGTTRPRVVVMERKGERRRGLFKTVETKPAGGDADRYQHEVAAYRLDRRLELGLVPVTVTREIDGSEGSLQSWVEHAVDMETAADYGLEMDRTAGAARDLARTRVFDALIGNSDRKPSDLVFPLDGSDRVYLIDHSRAFSLSWDPEWSRGLPDRELGVIEPRLTAGLRQLDRDSLVEELDGLLSLAQIDALLERRDRILERLGAERSYVEADERSLTAVP